MNLRKLEKEVALDQFSGWFQAAEILGVLKTKTVPLTVLEVGGYKGRPKDFISSENVTTIDLFDVKEKDYMRGNALDVPFKDGSFAYMVILKSRRPKHENK